MIIITLLITLLSYHPAQAYFFESSPHIHTIDNTNKETLTIGFGSCYDGLEAEKRPSKDNILSDLANESELDLWVWLGDFAYVDKKVLKRRSANLWERLLHLALKVPMAKAVY